MKSYWYLFATIWRALSAIGAPRVLYFMRRSVTGPLNDLIETRAPPPAFAVDSSAPRPYLPARTAWEVRLLLIDPAIETMSKSAGALDGIPMLIAPP